MPMKSVETSTPRRILALGAAETSYGGYVFAASSSSSSRAGAIFARKGARNAESVENKHSENVDVVESSLSLRGEVLRASCIRRVIFVVTRRDLRRRRRSKFPNQPKNATKNVEFPGPSDRVLGAAEASCRHRAFCASSSRRSRTRFQRVGVRTRRTRRKCSESDQTSTWSKHLPKASGTCFACCLYGASMSRWSAANSAGARGAIARLSKIPTKTSKTSTSSDRLSDASGMFIARRALGASMAGWRGAS